MPSLEQMVFVGMCFFSLPLDAARGALAALGHCTRRRMAWMMHRRLLMSLRNGMRCAQLIRWLALVGNFRFRRLTRACIFRFVAAGVQWAPLPPRLMTFVDLENRTMWLRCVIT